MTSLLDLGFVIPTTYGVIMIFGSLFIAIVICRNWKCFQSSFFKIYLYSTFLNLYSFINQFIAFRLPQSTCAKCLLAPFFENRSFWGFQWVTFMYVHSTMLQYNIILITSINRLTMVLYPFSYENIWKKMFWPLALVLPFVPVFSDYTILTGESYYMFVSHLDTFQMRSTAYADEMFYMLVGYDVAVTVISLIINIVTLFFLSKHNATEIKKSELNLCLMTAACVVIQILDCTRYVLQIMFGDHESRESAGSVLVMKLEPYMLDAMTLLSPLFLYLFSSKVRKAVNTSFCCKSTVLPLISEDFPSIRFASQKFR
ncbi:unnamed protein product [Auanema sp. JU1783]|nr:unnamed protein product [Auanema sp. JU1783]